MEVWEGSGKGGAVMRLVAMLAGLFGCRKEPKPASHTIEEISAVSISCSHMDHSYGYSFWLRREENRWLFDASCFTHDYEEETVFENREADAGNIAALLGILDQRDSIAYAENYKKPRRSPFFVLDETTYVFCLTFSDGSRYVTYDPQNELEEFFYRLAGQVKESKG